jgi:preprotein translocase SecE subunit
MQKDDSYWLKVAYVAFTALVFYVSTKAINTLGIQTGWIDRYDNIFRVATPLGGVIIALLSIFFLAKDKSRHEYFLAAIGELRKVTWPSLPDTRKMTVIVCVVVGIFAVILAMFDFVWAYALNLLIS